MNASLSIDTWMDAYESAFVEVAQTALGFPEVKVVARELRTADDLGGAYLALAGEHDTVQIGLVASPEDFQLLAKALLGMDPSEEALGPGDMADAVCEIVNVLAGIIKRRVHGRVPPLTLGLPIFVRGGVQPTERISMLVSDTIMGTIRASLVIIQPHDTHSLEIAIGRKF